MPEHMIVPVEWKAADGGGPGEIEGYFSVFGNVDQGGDVVLPGAYKNTLRYWAKQAQTGQPLTLIADHELSTDGVIGSVVNAREDAHGGWFRAAFSSDAKAQSIRRKMIEGHLKGVSFTYEAVKHHMGEVAGKSVRFLQELKLFEVTVTPFPMNELALASAKASVDNSSWDGNAAMSACTSASDYSAICAGRKAGPPDQRSSWALPHHSHPGGPPNAAGVRNALSRLPQTQGLTNKQAAEAHLKAHMSAISPAASAASADLRDAMHKAVEIPSAAARKAAVDALLDEYMTTEPEAPPADEPDAGAGDAAQDTPAEGDTTGTPDGLTPREYADMIANRGSADGSPASLDRLEAEIRHALEGI